LEENKVKEPSREIQPKIKLEDAKQGYYAENEDVNKVEGFSECVIGEVKFSVHGKVFGG
jgi:hypothetical protein